MMFNGMDCAAQSSGFFGGTDRCHVEKVKRVQRTFSSSTAKAATEDASFAFATSILRMTVLLSFVRGN